MEAGYFPTENQDDKRTLTKGRTKSAIDYENVLGMLP